MDIIEKVREEVLKINAEYMEKYEKYNFWEQHIKFVVGEALKLAEIYGANKEIVELGAMLHDIALMKKVGIKVDYHTNGMTIADDILTRLKYPKNKKKRVLGCVLHHRSSKNAENLEELCVCDADILANFDNIPMMFECAFRFHNIETIEEANQWIIKEFEKDLNDLSHETRRQFMPRFKTILGVLFVN